MLGGGLPSGMGGGMGGGNMPGDMPNMPDINQLGGLGGQKGELPPDLLKGLGLPKKK